jgi:hypothetical protein
VIARIDGEEALRLAVAANHLFSAGLAALSGLSGGLAFDTGQKSRSIPAIAKMK